MLYIFFVNTGEMMTFDMNLAIETVSNLKIAIWDKRQIPVNSQVLLISGGECLHPDRRVCDYNAAGTDTSPIFLFSKDSDVPGIMQPPQMLFEMASDGNSDSSMEDDNIRSRVRSCLQMEPNINTVSALHQMAIQLFHTDQNLYYECEKLVHYQHLQQQSWAAVVANLDDLVSTFEDKAKKIECLYQDILKNKDTYRSLLQNFEKDKEILSKIPILRCLVPKTENPENLSLLEWIQKKDANNALNELYCLAELDEYDDQRLTSLLFQARNALVQCRLVDMKEIRGLEQRLSTLEELIRNGKSTFERQDILNKGIEKTSNRISAERDISILPDLCQNNKEQLEQMLKNHQELLDLKSKCLNAKRELSLNLHKRLQWVIQVEEELKGVDDSLVVLGIRLQKLRNKLEIVQSLHTSPEIYFDSIVEVMRRKMFTEMFYTWGENVARTVAQMIETEVERRQKFSTKYDGHFLKCFFPGMNEFPENFVSFPVRIDQYLPQINTEDIKFLSDRLPEMSDRLVLVPCSGVPDVGQPTERSTAEGCQKVDSETSTDLTMKDIVQLEMRNSHLLKFNQLKATQLETQVQRMKKDQADFRSVVDDHNQDLFNDFLQLQTTMDDIQRQVAKLEKTAGQRMEKITEMESKFRTLKGERKNERKQCELLTEQLAESIKSNRDQAEQVRKLRDQCRRYETVFRNIRSTRPKLWSLGQEMKTCRRESQIKMKTFHDEDLTGLLANLRIVHQDYQERHRIAMEEARREFAAERDQQLQKLREQLNQDHRNEVESLRHRFKLAIHTTSIERTGSETSLEKVHLDLVDQSAQEKEIQKLQKIIDDQRTEMEQQMEKERAEHAKTIQTLKEDFSRQKRLWITEGLKKVEGDMNADYLMQKMRHYETTLNRLRRIIVPDTDTTLSPETIRARWGQEMAELQRNLDSVNNRSFISIPTLPDSPQANRRPPLLSAVMALSIDSTTNNLSVVEPNIEKDITAKSCDIGNIVLVYYESKYEKFIVYQTETQALHYVHSDSLKDLDICKDPSTNNRDWLVAKVTEKEYCQIKKEQNRYKLPLNTKFYRVKVKPLKTVTGTEVIRLKQLATGNDGVGWETKSSTPTLMGSVTSPGNRPTLSHMIYSFFATSGSVAEDSATTAAATEALDDDNLAAENPLEKSGTESNQAK